MELHLLPHRRLRTKQLTCQPLRDHRHWQTALKGLLAEGLSRQEAEGIDPPIACVGLLHRHRQLCRPVGGLHEILVVETIVNRHSLYLFYPLVGSFEQRIGQRGTAYAIPLFLLIHPIFPD